MSRQLPVQVHLLLAAQAAGDGSSGVPCDFRQQACPDGGACLGYKGTLEWPQSAGRCVAATARYVPAYSTMLRCAVGLVTSKTPAKGHVCFMFVMMLGAHEAEGVEGT